MFNNQRIIFVSIIDNGSNMMESLSTRIWQHENLVKGLTETKNCLIGRKTFEITRWKGSNTWVLTRNKNWKARGVGTIHDIEDLHLHIEGDIYILGGQSLFHQFADSLDEIHLFVLNNYLGKEQWIKIKMSEWKATNYDDQKIWSYVNLHRREIREIPKSEPLFL